MCGRLNITDDPLARLVSEIVGIPFAPIVNQDLRPTQKVSVISSDLNSLSQIDLNWGIKPTWAQRVIINAQAETVFVKPTFRDAFEISRVIVPCNGWYEWVRVGKGKRKYQISDLAEMPLFMAGIALDGYKHLVTLTVVSNEQYEKYHDRMPLLVAEDAIRTWLCGDLSHATWLLANSYTPDLKITEAK